MRSVSGCSLIVLLSTIPVLCGQGCFLDALNPLIAGAGEDKAVLPSRSVMLDGTAVGGFPPYAFAWAPTDGLSDPSVATPIATPPASTEYTLSVTDSTGRTATASVLVRVEQATFQGLGGLPGCLNSYASAVSGDGQVVVGCSGPATYNATACQWSNGVVTSLGGLPGAVGCEPEAVSQDGSVIVGSCNCDRRAEAFRWTPSDGMSPLGELSIGVRGRVARAVSADGAVIVGLNYLANYTTEPFRWSEGEGFSGLALPEGVVMFQVWGVSADGSVVVGNGGVTNSSSVVPFEWTTDRGVTQLSCSYVYGSALDISADGTVLVGDCGFPFRWTEATGMVNLSEPLDGTFWYGANSVSAHGEVIVGKRSPYIEGGDDSGKKAEHKAGVRWESVEQAFIWDEEHGLRLMEDMLVDDFGLDLSGWQLNDATGVSDDGLTIVGNGTNPAGQLEAWMVRLPALSD